MAIQPIDLQTLFSQMDKVGKTQSEQKEGVQIQQSLQGAVSQRKVEERIRSVNEAPDTGDGLERVKDRQRRPGERNRPKDKDDSRTGDEGGEAAPEGGSEIVTDPALGRNVDLSG